MCRIFYFQQLKNKKLTGKQLDELQNLLDSSHYQNPDGIGYYYNNEVVKSVTQPIEFNKSIIELLKNGLTSPLILHYRFATHGIANISNCQPLESENYIIIHNGIFDKKDIINPTDKIDTLNDEFESPRYPEYKYYSYRRDKQHSDTKEFLNKLEEYKDIAKTLKEFDDSSYSMFIIEKSTGKVYYTKSKDTNFTFYYDTKTGLFFGSTTYEIESLFSTTKGLLEKPSNLYTFTPAESYIYKVKDIIRD